MTSPPDTTWDLVLNSPCKINLSLEVLGRRPDGYHDLRSVFHALDLCDRIGLRACPGGRVQLSCNDPELPCDDSNLVVRAARLVQQQCGAQRGARIRLQKRIPMGGGLGGGSSNAAVTLLGLNRLWQARLSRAELYEMAAELGSDVAFFLEGGTALCTGRGEQVEPVPGVAALHVVLVLPGVHVSTPAVYRALNSALTTPRQPSNNVIKALREGDFQRLVRSLHNDLQEPALRLEERLRSIWEELRRCVSGVGRTGCLLSGSGSSFFVLAQDQESCRRCATAIAAELDLPCVAATSYPAWHTRVEKLIARRGSL